MLPNEQQGKRRYALVGVVALVALLVCVGALMAQQPQAESLEHHEQLARLGLGSDGPKPKPKPKKLPPAILRKIRCRRAANSLANRLSIMTRLCTKLGKRPVNKRRCIGAIKRTISFPFVHVVDEPKEFARGRKPVTIVFDCAEDLFKFAMGKRMGKPKKKISIVFGFGAKRLRVFASACSAKGVSAFLRPPTEVVKFQGKKVTLIGKDTVMKMDAKRVRRGMKVSKLAVLAIADISRRPKLGVDGEEDYLFEEEDEQELEADDME